jgi:hypothetical protein
VTTTVTTTITGMVMATTTIAMKAVAGAELIKGAVQVRPFCGKPSSADRNGG